MSTPSRGMTVCGRLIPPSVVAHVEAYAQRGDVELPLVSRAAIAGLMRAGWTREEAVRDATHHRIADRVLQRLKRQGKIVFDRKFRTWRVVKTAA